MLDDLQKRTAQAIVNVFETGSARGRYGQVTLLPGDKGHLTYGRAQTTLSSGNLHLLIESYCGAQGAAFGPQLASYLPRLDACDLTLDHDADLRELLRSAGDDPVMQTCQDDFFDRVYWKPAMRSAAHSGIKTALGCAIVYDSVVHGSWTLIRERTNQKLGTIASGASEEKRWLTEYVRQRHAWLVNHFIPILRKTAYRMEAFELLIRGDKWSLALPLTVRNVKIDRAVLLEGEITRASAEIAEVRLLKLRDPFMQGEDVRLVQQALIQRGAALEADGVFGPGTADAVRAFQATEGLTVDGVVGNATRAALGVL